MQWSRQGEHGWEPKGRPTLIGLRAALDDKGELVAWESGFHIPEGARGDLALVAAELADLPHEIAMSPGNITRNSEVPYTIPNICTVCRRLAQAPFKPSWIRTPGRLQNTYANEAFMDERAVAAGVDPFDFRLKHLKDQRGRNCCNGLRPWPGGSGVPRRGGTRPAARLSARAGSAT